MFARISLLWKILLATSIALTLLFGATGWFVQDRAVEAISRSVEEEVQSSFQAYDSLWRTRAETLASVSLVMSRMSDVRAAFSTRDEATIRDSAAELWSSISRDGGIFVVTDPQGGVIASLGGELAEPLRRELPVVRAAAPSFPKQSSGFMISGGRLYQVAVTPVFVQTSTGMGLLNVLVAGYAVEQNVVQQLKTATGSDFVFTANGVAAASTLSQAVSAALKAGEETGEKDGDKAGEGPRRLQIGPAAYTMLSTPLLDVLGKPIGELRVLRSFESASENIASLRRGIVWVWLVAMCLGLASSYYFAKRVLEPVKLLDKGAAEVARGNYEYRIPLDPSQQADQDELTRLARAFNSMCASLRQGRDELIRQERIATIGRMATSIVHDLRNPLAAIYGGAEMMMDSKLSAAQSERLAANIYRSSRRIQQLLQELVDTGRGPGVGNETCRLNEIVSAALEVYAGAADTQAVLIETAIPADLELPADRARMERVFLNLIDNALAAMPKGGTLNITAMRDSAKADHESVLIRVEDSGPGISPEIRQQLFQPFVTSGKKNGVGLGLAFSRQTVLDHGGELWIDDKAGGACFLMRLPA